MTGQLLLLAQSSLPKLDGMYWLMLASRVLHILGAIVLVGGLFYLRTVVTPSVVPAAAADQQFGGRRAAWAKWVGIATLVLLATGLWNYVQIIKLHERFAPSYHIIAGLKMLAALALFFLASLLAGRSAAAEALRDKMRSWLGVALALGILTVVLGGVLRSYPHTPNIDAAGPPALSAPSNTPPTE